MGNTSGKDIKIKKGELVLITTGCYSDYEVLSVSRALVDFDMRAAAKLWINGREGQYLDESGFVAELHKNHLLEDSNSRHVHLADSQFTSEGIL